MTGLPAGQDDQAAVIAFLSDPASYGGCGEVARIDTHCSIVFLAADRAYKLKRALRYASLDYTTRERREAACAAELVLNRRTAPALYLGLRAITRDAGGRLGFDGDGRVLDHVVVMRRFAQDDLFDRMAQADRLTPAVMRATGAAVAHLHIGAARTPLHGGSAAIGRVIAENDRELAKVAAALDGAFVGVLSRRTRAALDDVAALLDRRRDEGKVRRCHGDLRLANICLQAGRPTLFDCIEFSEEIGCIDTLYDLAFLLMDLQLCGRGDLGNAVFNAYLDLVPETDGLRALPLFLALRAATRSYALAGSAHRRTDPREAARLMASARHHIDAGIGFLAPRRPVLILLGGGPDCDRGALAAWLSGHAHPAPGARILRLAPPEAPQETPPWPAAAAAVLSAGCSVLIAGGFAAAADRQAAAGLAARLGIDLMPFWAGAPPPGLDARLWRRFDAGMDAAAALAGPA